MSDRTLILPLVVDGPSRLGFLGRQIPLAWLSALRRNVEGFDATPLVKRTSDGPRFVEPRRYSDSRARRVARERGFDTVVHGHLECRHGTEVRRLHLRALDVASGEILFEKTVGGGLFALIRQGLAALATIADAPPTETADLFDPQTSSAAAYEKLLEGLDHILILKTGAAPLDRGADVISVFTDALRLDPEYRAARSTGVYCATLALGSKRFSFDSGLLADEILEWCRMFPEDADVHILAADALVRSQRLQDAADLLSLGLQGVLARDHRIYRLLGDVQAGLGHIDEAFEAYRESDALEEDPKVVHSLAGLAMILGRNEDARIYARRVVDDDPDEAVFHGFLAMDAYRRGEIDETWGRFRDALDASRGPGRAVFEDMARVLEQAPPPEGFRDALRHWQPPSPFSVCERVLLGRVLRLAGARLEARLCLKPIDPGEIDDDGTREILAEERQVLGLDPPVQPQ